MHGLNFNYSNLEKSIMPQHAHQIRFTSFRRFPYVYLQLPSIDVAKQIMFRSVLIDVLIEVISEGKTYEEIIKNTDLNRLN